VKKRLKRLTDSELRRKLERQLSSHIEANKVKDQLMAKGYNYTVSLYGVLFNPETAKNEYRRIEVFLNSLPTRNNIESIYNFFNEIKPYFYYTIWAYNEQNTNIILIEGWS
jgi:hypothetical protein